MDDFYLKCPYCDSGTLLLAEMDGAECDACGKNFDVRTEVLSGKDFEIADGKFISALRIAVRHGWHDEINTLLEGGYDINRIDFDGKTCLKYAVDHIGLDNQEVFVNTALLLIEQGADVNICDSVGNCPLHSAVRYICLPVVNSLIMHGANVNAVGEDGMTPLHYCGEPYDYLEEELHEEAMFADDPEYLKTIEHRQEEIALTLLSARANPNIQQLKGWTPLSRIAYLGGNPNVVKLLIGHGADRNHIADSGFSPLGYARSKASISPRHAAVAKVLAESGAADRRPGMCFVATAVYGNEDTSPVMILRWYRDHILANDPRGRAFIGLYNAHGPKVAEIVVRIPILRKTAAIALNQLVGRIKYKYDLTKWGD